MSAQVFKFIYARRSYQIPKPKAGELINLAQERAKRAAKLERRRRMK